MVTDPVSKTVCYILCLLVHYVTDKLQNPHSPKCNIIMSIRV